MVLLANAMCLIDWMERNSRVGELREAAHKFLQLENLEKVVHSYDKDSIGPQALLTVSGFIFLRLIDVSPYQANVRRALDGLGIEIAETEEDGEVRASLKRIDTYNYVNRKRNLADLMSQKEIFLEHVMVCEYLRSMMPVTGPNVWDNFKSFNVCYALLKGILIGSFNSSPSDAEVVDTILVLHRMFIHNYDAIDRTREQLQAIQLTNLMSMVALAKG
jgi:hypothetical protein